MRDRDDLTAADRRSWLAEIADAIEDAQRLAWRLGVSEGHSSEALRLYGELELARAELEALRKGAIPRLQAELPPIWLQSIRDSDAAKPRDD